MATIDSTIKYDSMQELYEIMEAFIVRYGVNSNDLKIKHQNRRHIEKKDSLLARQSSEGFSIHNAWNPNASGSAAIPLLLLLSCVVVTSTEIQNRSINNNKIHNAPSKTETCPAAPYNTTNIQVDNYRSKSILPLGSIALSTSKSLNINDLNCPIKARIIRTEEKKTTIKSDRNFVAHSRARTFNAKAGLKNFIKDKEVIENNNAEGKLEECYHRVFNLSSVEPSEDSSAHEEAYDFVESQKEFGKLKHTELMDKWIKVNEILKRTSCAIRNTSIIVPRQVVNFDQYHNMRTFLKDLPSELACYEHFLNQVYSILGSIDSFEIKFMIGVYLDMHKIPFFANNISSFVNKYYELNTLKEEQIMSQLEELFFNLQQLELTPIEKAAYAHMRLIEIHPFHDGNGRTARLLQNTILKESGYPSVPVGEGYYDAIQESLRKKDSTPYQDYLCTMFDIKWSCLQAAGYAHTYVHNPS